MISKAKKLLFAVKTGNTKLVAVGTLSLLWELHPYIFFAGMMFFDIWYFGNLELFSSSGIVAAIPVILGLLVAVVGTILSFAYLIASLSSLLDWLVSVAQHIYGELVDANKDFASLPEADIRKLKEAEVETYQVDDDPYTEDKSVTEAQS